MPSPNERCPYCSHKSVVPSSNYDNRNFCYKCSASLCSNCNVRYIFAGNNECDKCGTLSPSKEDSQLSKVTEEEDFDTAYDNLLSKAILENLHKPVVKTKIAPQMWTGSDDIFLP